MEHGEINVAVEAYLRAYMQPPLTAEQIKALLTLIKIVKSMPEEEFIKIAKLLNELRNKMNGKATKKEINELKKVSTILKGIND